MAFVPKDNTGSLFRNEKKREGKRDADYAGSATVDGVDYWVDSWINNNPKAEDYDPQKKTYLSLKFRPKDDGQRAPRQSRPAAGEPQRRQAPRPPSQSDPTALHATDQSW